MQTLSTYDALLQDVYRGQIVQQFNDGAYAIEMIQRRDANEMGAFNGRRLVFAVRSGRNRGRSSGMMDGGELPTAGRQKGSDGIVTIKSHAQAIELSDQVIRQSASNEAAFVAALEDETDRAAVDLKRDVNRQVNGTGDGLLSACADTRDATTISVVSGQYIAVGDPVEVRTMATGSLRNSATVTAVRYTGRADDSTQANADIDLDTRTSVTAAEGVYIRGSRGNESDGFRNIIAANRRLHEIDSSVAGMEFWDGNVYDANWAQPDEDFFMRSAQTSQQISGRGIDEYLTTFGVQRRLANTYGSQKNLTDARGLDVPAGYAAIMVSAGGRPIPVIADVDSPNGNAIGLRKDTFAWTELGKPDWLTPPEGGGKFQLKPGTTAGTYDAAWMAWFIWYSTLTCVQPNANNIITRLRDDIPVARY